MNSDFKLFFDRRKWKKKTHQFSFNDHRTIYSNCWQTHSRTFSKKYSITRTKCNNEYKRKLKLKRSWVLKFVNEIAKYFDRSMCPLGRKIVKTRRANNVKSQKWKGPITWPLNTLADCITTRYAKSALGKIAKCPERDSRKSMWKEIAQVSDVYLSSHARMLYHLFW